MLLQADLQRLQAHVAGMRQAASAAQERVAAAERAQSGDRAYLQVRQAQQMTAAVAARRSELAAKLARLQERRDALTPANSTTAGA
jgi:intraflagellar transport protein 81